jgi:hypothetical protein
MRGGDGRRPTTELAALVRLDRHLARVDPEPRQMPVSPRAPSGACSIPVKPGLILLAVVVGLAADQAHGRAASDLEHGQVEHVRPIRRHNAL